MAREVEDTRTGLSKPVLRRAFTDNLFYVQGRSVRTATKNDLYMALAYTVRDRVLERFLRSSYQRRKDLATEKIAKFVAYLSAEFLTGPFLDNNLVNLGIEEEVRAALDELGIDLDELVEFEVEPGLGNGGLGRLAACYLDSLATREIPAIGYGIRYEFGIFHQDIRDGRQTETTDKWLHLGNPWEIRMPSLGFTVSFGGRTESYVDKAGKFRVRWLPERAVRGIAYDTPVLGYRVAACNVLRLWSAEAVESFDFQAFNVGDYYGAVEAKVASENLTKVLYPNDESLRGKQLRLEQQFFFVSCSLQDLIKLALQDTDDLRTLPQRFAIQLNDTHPSIAVAELMRLLMDEHLLDWNEAWKVTTETLGYTNHTIMPEALEKWSLSLFGSLLPRHLEIIFEINRRFLGEVRLRYFQDEDRVRRMSIIEESGEQYVRMAHLACTGSHAINGVSQLHTQLLKDVVMRDFNDLWPEKFLNITNGVTPRRWILLSNPGLSRLISHTIEGAWARDLYILRGLEKFADNGVFQEQWAQVKRQNKERLAAVIRERTGVAVDPDSLFDIQVKRIHEYKRQHLNVLNIVALYTYIKRNPSAPVVPRTFIFGGKAAPGYFMAKLIIKLINSVADIVNNDADMKDKLKVVFFPDFSVKNGQLIYPAADISEQISTAGTEASGTGNMKFAMNGALTIGTLDGANIEIREEVGPENFFEFGLSVEEVQDMRMKGYRPRDFYESNQTLREAIDLVASGFFSDGSRELFEPLIEALLVRDSYAVLADFQAYSDCQARAAEAYRDETGWIRKSILNVARMGRFSSDRAIREYSRKIWGAQPAPVLISGEPYSEQVRSESRRKR
jgi:starch phosphorylase